MKLNCWQVMHCGREPGGINVDNEGICPAAKASQLNGAHFGKNGGRCCWAIAGTFSDNHVTCSFAKKLQSCEECDFYKFVANDMQNRLISVEEIIENLSKNPYRVKHI